MCTLWMTYDIAKRLWNPKIGLYAGFLLAITLHFILQAKSGQLDAPVAFWVMLGCYGLLRHLILGPAWKWYYLAFFAMGMGIITKGVGFLPVLMLFALIITPPTWHDKKNRQLLTPGMPSHQLVTISRKESPAVHRWQQHHSVYHRRLRCQGLAASLAYVSMPNRTEAKLLPQAPAEKWICALTLLAY